MTARPYRSEARDAAAAETQRRLVEAATELLNQAGELKGFSLQAVARRAGVSRLTVYNQFGSRRGLLEAVFDETARAGGLFGLAEVFAMADTHAALARTVEVFCRFWAAAPPMMARLHGAAETDPELGEAIGARNERRRCAMRTLVDRLVAAGEVEAGRAEALTDLIFALTGFAFFDALRHGGRSVEEVCGLIQAQVEAAVRN